MLTYLAFGLGFYLGAAVMMLKDMIRSYQAGTTILQFLMGAVGGILLWLVIVLAVAYHQYMDYRSEQEFNEEETQG